jgi:shikimate dehydrogenase
MTPTACVIGWPIAQSRSPMIHSHWLAQHGLAGRYIRKEVEPSDLARFMQEVRDGDYIGCNVTVPHKETVMPLLDEITPTARAIGAVNTVWREGARLVGGNTDADGYIANLDELAPGWDAGPLRAVVLGAGGAARAVAYGLQQRGAEAVLVVNRSRDRADRIAQDFGGCVRAADWQDLPRHFQGATLLVNATSLGMAGKEPLTVDLAGLDARAVVSDIVYVPLVTDLLASARKSGFRTVEGLGMLLHQAVPGFERWFGVRPAVTPELRALVQADIEAAA